MARSTKIYLVYIRDVSKFPQAVFTVKHEAITYIKRTFSSTEDIELYTMPDGVSEYPKKLEIE